MPAATAATSMGMGWHVAWVRAKRGASGTVCVRAGVSVTLGVAPPRWVSAVWSASASPRKVSVKRWEWRVRECG